MATFIFPAQSIDTTGLATEAKQDTIITELNSINTDMDTLVAIDYATSTKQDSIIAELQDIEADVEAGNALLTTIDADTSTIASDTTSIDTNVSTIAGAVSGSEMQVDIVSSALPSGAATAANQSTIISQTAAITPIDFLDSGVVDSSSTNITAAGLSIVASLAADCVELEIVEDIGEFMTITDGADAVLAYLPLGGGRVKLSISSGTALKLASVSGATISVGKIAINFLG